MFKILVAALVALLSIEPAYALSDIIALDQGWSFDTTITSDYVSRGVSQSNTHAAIQGDATYMFGNGWYVTGFASTVSLNGDTSHAEVDPGFGYKGRSNLLTYDTGIIATTYPGSAPHYHGNFVEAHGILNYDLGWGTAVGSLWTSPNNQGHSGFSVYVNAGLDVKLPYDMTLGGRVGHTSTRNPEKFGMPDYTDWQVNLTRDMFGMNVGFSFSGTSTRVCNSGPCGNRISLSLTKNF